MSEAPKKKTSGKRMNAADVAAAGAMWEAGLGSIDSISKRYGVGARTLQRHFAKKGFVKDSKVVKMAEVAAEALVRTAFEKPEEHARKCFEARESTRKAAVFVERMTLKIATDAARERRKLTASDTIELKAYHITSQILKNTQFAQFNALGITADDEVDNSELPELRVTVMSDDDIRAEQEKSNEIGDDLGLPAPEIPEVDEGDVIEGDEAPNADK
jgi:hypothetical protein